MSEDKERTLETLEAVERVASSISTVITVFVLITFAGQLLGINMAYIWYLIATFHWVIPKWFIEKYYSIWYMMAWALLLLLTWDAIYQNLYSQRHGEPNHRYGLYVNAATFLLAFWLSLLFHFGLFEFVAALSFVSLLYLLLSPSSPATASAPSSW